MIFAEKKIKLKNGVNALLKTPTGADAENMLNYIKTACGETEFLLRYPEEYENTTVEQEKNWLEGQNSSKNILLIACFVEGKIVGNCTIVYEGLKKTAHRAGIAIGILKEYWNIGIGSAMFNEMILSAKNRGTEIIELEFIEGNERGRHLYEKFGFTVVCEKPNVFKLKDGTYRSEFHMQKYL